MYNYEKLCNLDYLGTEEKYDKSDDFIYEKFGCRPETYFKTNFIWKENHLPLRNSKVTSLEKMSNLMENLHRSKKLEPYDEVIQCQIEESVKEMGVETEDSEKG